MITVPKQYSHKLEKYLKHYYKSADSKTNIEIIVFPEDEEPIRALQKIQSKISSDLIVMEAGVLIDTPLDEILDTHVLSKSSLTVLAKEYDMKKTNKGPKLADVEGQDIFGISSWSDA